MAKIVVECADPNDLDAVEAAAESFIGRCNITYFKQAEAMKEVGTVSSDLAAAKKIAEDTGESIPAVRSKIQRGRAQVAQPTEFSPTTPQSDNEIPNNQTISEKSNEPTQPAKDESARGGKREGAGRPVKSGKSKRKKSQNRIWQNVENKLSKLTEYIRANCEFPGNISDKTKKAISRHIDDLNMFYNDL